MGIFHRIVVRSNMLQSTGRVSGYLHLATDSPISSFSWTLLYASSRSITTLTVNPVLSSGILRAH